ncbi:MAG: class I SAM-dependent methyltransferase [Chloroflexi bacterium]|nr:class I SAM-dependent methyltransferase [Chloroflexota bacterium]
MSKYSIGEYLEKALALLGWGIYPLGETAQGADVGSALEHNTPERTDQLYRNARVLQHYLNPARLRYYESLVHLLPLETYHQRHIADAGCGPGYFLLQLRRTVESAGFRPASLTGFDYSLAALEIARQILPEADFSQLDITTPLERRFDILFCMDVLEHLLYPARALHNLLQMLAPGGALVLAVPNGRYDYFAGHVNFWSPESWRVFLETAGPGYAVTTGLVGNGRLAGERHVNVALLKAIVGVG